jgi:hypothetical protein
MTTMLLWFVFTFLGGVYAGRQVTILAFLDVMGLNVPTSERRQQG